MYSLLRNLLFCLPAETSHDVALNLMSAGQRLGVLGLLAARTGASTPVRVMGLDFPNPVGLAAGLDKNADHLDALAALGFGFIEVGTLTPRAQPGNPRPRMFRLRREEAIINRMGFNNKGIDHALARISASPYRGILGINIGKNFDTPIERAAEDYLHCLHKCYVQASYVTINLSSPNTPGLRELQFGQHLKDLLQQLKDAQQSLAAKHGRQVPLAIKLAPDLQPQEIREIAEQLLAHQVDAIIATNTTMGREGVTDNPLSAEAGGLSGRPLTAKSTAVIRAIREVVGDRIPIIGVGGIFSARDARDKIEAGASLVQLYTGFIYRGPPLISEIREGWPATGNPR